MVEIKTKKTAKKETKTVLGYFVSADSGTAKLILKSHDNDTNGQFVKNSTNTCVVGLGIQNVEYVKKYQVDALGNRSEIKQESRVMTQKKKR